MQKKSGLGKPNARFLTKKETKQLKEFFNGVLNNTGIKSDSKTSKENKK